MTNPEIRSVVLSSLKKIAPEADLDGLHGSDDLRDTLDIDSMDFNSFILSLHTTLKVDIGEKDYPRFYTLDGCIAELAARLSASSAS
jgi:hypothetical protein